LGISRNAASVVNWFNFFIHCAEYYVHNDRYYVDKEYIFEAVTSAKIQKAILLVSCGNPITVDKQAIGNCHVSDEFPIISF
jgi:hypothetical protein